MNTGISTLVDLSLSIEEISKLIAEVGFTHLSLSHDVRHVGYHIPQRRESLRKLWDDLGIKLNYIHPPLECYHDLTSLDDQVRRSSIEMMKMALDATADMGGSAITIHMANDWELPADEFPGRIPAGLESLKELREHAAGRGVMICVENLPLLWNFGLLSLEIIRATADWDDVKVCLDSCHATMSDHDTVALVRELAPRVTTTHLSDTMGEDDSHLIPGEGNVDYPMIAAELGRGGFDGVVDLECSLWMLRKRHDQNRTHHGDPAPCSTEHYLEKALTAAKRIGDQIEQAKAAGAAG